ncbi:hypothetical protein ACK8P5_14345 [Paenibacillus sp. EC2-1]|uniref:hypothetical protein n=1 Tax=Paenibacillus sp. EC2-1 TaxID=3388665 RepID=UPI003BEEF6EF
MRTNMKVLVALGLLLIGAVTLGVLSSSAKDTLTSQPTRNIEVNKQSEEKVLVQVGSNTITNIQLLNYKEYNSISPATLTDSEILKHMIKEELFLQLADKEGVSASLEEGRQEAVRMKQLLSEQPQEVQDTHNKLIDTMGVTEKEYWEKIAPPEYQKLLSKQNVAAKIQQDIQSAQKDKSDVPPSLNEFKEQLYQSSMTNGTVQIKDKDVILE